MILFGMLERFMFVILFMVNNLWCRKVDSL